MHKLKMFSISLVFAVVLISSSSCMANTSEEVEPREDTFEDNFICQINNDGNKTCTIIGYGDVNTNIIPGVINGYTVTRIGDGAFKDVTQLIGTITLPDTVISIGNEAFSGCSRIIEMALGKSLTSIGDKAFYTCSSLEKINFNSNIERIGEEAFNGCVKLRGKDFIIPDKVTYIGNRAFRLCSLRKIKFDSAIAPKIETETFAGCNNTDIIVPKYGEGYTNQNNWPDKKIVVLYGDITEDNVADAVDAATILTLFKNGTLTDEDKLVADIDDNDVIDAVDAATILTRFKNKKGTVGKM